MSSVLAIVSKAVFEKQAAGASLGAVLALDQYGSTHATLAGLAGGGALFLVTVRPPDEQLWLVAVLEHPKLGKTGWTAAANRVPITNVSKLKKKLLFATGTGLQAKPGALGMSLQTPRGLTDADVALLRGATGKPAKTSGVITPAKMATPKAKQAKKAKPAAPASSAQPVIADGSAHLAVLQQAVAAKDGAAALTAALAWWRAHRSPALADLIDAISERISGSPVTSEIEFTKVAATKNPLDLGRLLPAVTELQVNYLPAVSELLAAYPDDPRITKAFASWTLVPITTSISKTSFWSKMHATVDRIGDVRIAPALKKRLAQKQPKTAWWGRYYNRLERTLAKLPVAPPIDGKPLAKLAIGKLAPIATAKPAKPVVNAAPKLAGPLLAQAATHLAAGRTAAGIDAMVAHWRETRVPALADLIDRATRLLPTHDHPLLPCGDANEAQATWLLTCETDPGTHLPQLLRTVMGASRPLNEVRIAMIAGLPDDPRISLRLAEISDIGGEGEAKFSKTLFETLARHRDVRTCGPVRALFQDFVSTYRYTERPAKRFMSKFALAPETFFETWPLALDAADQKLFDKLDAQVDAVKKTFTRERGLIAAIAADWKSNGPREVYADWLMEREHPRGELIMLESRTKPNAEETERLEQLQRLSLFGALRGLIDSDSKRERGLYREVKPYYSANTLSWRAAAACPLVALIETIVLEEYEHLPTPEDFRAFVAAATSLRVIKGMDKESIALLDPDHAAHWKVAGQRAVRLA